MSIPCILRFARVAAHMMKIPAPIFSALAGRSGGEAGTPGASCKLPCTVPTADGCALGGRRLMPNILFTPGV